MVKAYIGPIVGAWNFVDYADALSWYHANADYIYAIEWLHWQGQERFRHQTNRTKPIYVVDHAEGRIRQV